MNQEVIRSLFDLMSGTTPTTTRQSRHRSRQSNRTLTEPSIDTFVDDTAMYIFIELPGVRKEDMKIDVFNNKLTVCAEKVRTYDEPTTSELYYGHLERVINLPFCVTKPETVTSTYKDGLLKIKINRLAEESNRFTVQPN